MRKILSFVAAMLVAIVANSAVIQITPTSPQAADNLRLALNSAVTGDVIEMAAGTYVESNGDYIAFTGKDVTVKAAEGAEVIIQPQVPITVSEGGCAHFVDVKIDASRLTELATWYEHLIYAADANTQNRIVLQGCELYGFNLNKSMLYCSSANVLNAVTINRCYIHNNMKSILFVENTSASIEAVVANSTFANISTNTESYWAGIIDLRADAAQLLVDHCTFYNVIPMNTDYSCVSKITLANGVTSNCIFMLPTAQDGIRAMRGVAATNCITYNYLKDSGTGIHSSVTQTNCVQADPLFVDAANGNFTLGEGSPALTMNDGQPIGDPRWAPAPAPIGGPAYYLVGNMNNWTPDSAYKFAVNPANENEYMLNTTLAVGDSVKVLGIVGNTQTWYPDNAPNYGVDAAHAGKKTIYFQTTYKADWAEFGGFMWMEANPQPKATLDFTANTTWNFPTDAKAVAAAAFSDGTYSITLEGTSGNGYRWYSNGNYLLNGKEGAKLTLPAFTWKTTKIVVTGNSGASKDTKMNIFVGDSAVSTETTGSKEVNTYEIAEAYQAPGNVYVLKVTSAHNAQFTKIEIYGEDAPEPQGCDWNNIPFLGDGSIEQTYANQFKVCVGDPAPTQVVNIQQPGWAAAPGIFMSFPAAPITAAAPLAEDQYAVDGAGVVLYVSAFTAKETEVTITANNVDYVVTVLNVNGTEPQPEVNYSLKNNWDAAADWTWKEMTKDGDNYKLENVVFGGTGVNYQADLPGAPEMWVPMADFLGDKVDAKDTVTFVLNPADSTITATLLGKYIEPTPVIPMALYKAVAATDTAAGAIYVDNEYMKIQTVYKGTIVEHSANIFDETFTHAIQVRVDNFPTAENPTGTKKDGSTPLVITAKKSAPFILYYVRQAVDKQWTENDNKDMILFDQAAPTTKLVAASMVEDSVLVDSSYYYIGKAFELVEGHTYTLAAKGTTIKLLGFKYPDVQHTYTVAGAPATLFGQEWAPSYAANDLEPIVGGEYTHGWKKDSVALAAGEVTFKIVEDHAWAHAWPAQNYVLNIPEDGLYNISILFNQYAEADSLKVSAIAQKVGEAVVIPTVIMHGNFTGTWADTKAFTLAADSLTASLRLGLEAKAYEFGMKFDGVWKANGANITREAPSACLATGDGNMHITADQAGEYTFTYTFATQTLEVAYPELIVLKNCLEVYSMAKNDVVNLNPVTVTYVNGKNVFVKDEAGAMLLYMPNTNFAWKAGDQLTGLVAPIDIYNGLYELKPDTNQVKNVIVAEGAAPAPEEMTFISDSLDMNKYIVVRGIEFAADTAFVTTKSTTININVGNQAIALYNKFKLAYAFEAGKKYDIVAAVSYYNALQLYFISAEESVARPTTAPAAPTQAEEDVMAIYCDYYKTNNLHFGISGWAGAYEILNIEDTKIAYWKAMTWECVIDPVNTDSIHDLSAYKKLHVDFWAPAAAKIKFTAEAVAGGNYKDGVVLDLAEGWTSWDIEIATWPGQYDFANLKCFALEGYKTPEGESFEGNPFAVANIYFYEKKAEGFENIDASVKAVKVLQNGQIFILRGDKVYTVTGQPIAK